jgi:hypothetical protein
LVVSPGGVATTTLMEFLEKFIVCNDPHDQDELKHLPSINTRKGKIPKVIFITGDDEDIERSLSRRGWFFHHGALLGNPLCELGIIPKRVRKLWVLKGIEEQKKFFTNLEAHRSDILILNYEEIWNKKDVIAMHCNIKEPDFVLNFPKKKKRNG